MYCSHCGTQLSDDAKFCPNCGAQVERQQNTQYQSNTTSSSSTTSDPTFTSLSDAQLDQMIADLETKKNNWLVIMIIGIFLSRILMIVALVIMLDASSKYDKAKKEKERRAANPYKVDDDHYDYSSKKD